MNNFTRTKHQTLVIFIEPGGIARCTHTAPAPASILPSSAFNKAQSSLCASITLRASARSPSALSLLVCASARSPSALSLSAASARSCSLHCSASCARASARAMAAEASHAEE